MSYKYFENQENINVPNSKRIKISDGIGRGAIGRTVLGNLNTSNVRIQPRRAAKQGVNYERGVPKFIQDKKKSFAISASGLIQQQRTTLSSSNNSSSFSQQQKPSFFSSTSSSGFSIYNDSSASTSTSSFNTNKNVLLPPSSFTSSTSLSSENSNDASYLSGLASVPTLPTLGISNSTTLSSRIKQSLKVSVPSDYKPTSICNKEHDYFKPKLALPINFTASTSAIPQYKKLVVSIKKLPEVPSSSKLPKWSDTSLREELILNRREENIWINSPYAAEAYAHLRRQELKHKPKANYIQKQAEITTNMRWILIDWLVEVASEYDLYAQTLYLAVSYVDRFLSFMSVKRDKLQLVGTTAMFIASKYEEIYPPEAKQFAYITDSTYRISQIIKMEQLILRVLNFDVSNPTILEFTDNFSKMCNSTDKTMHLCQFISELSMLECEPFLRYAPSMIAASALALANYTLELPIWPEELRFRSGYDLQDLKECYLNLNRSYCHIHEYKTHSIREKYRANILNCVSDILPRSGFPFL